MAFPQYNPLNEKKKVVKRADPKRRGWEFYNPARIAIKTPLMRKATPHKVNFSGKTQSFVSGFCFPPNRVCSTALH